MGNKQDSSEEGKIGKNQIISCRDNAPIRIIKDDHYYDKKSCISGGSFPGYKCILDYLYSIDVRMIVTLTIEPLKIGRNINHVPHSHEHTQWMDSDITEDDLNRFKLVHIPIADNSFPTPKNSEKLISTVKEFMDTYSVSIGLFEKEYYPESKIYLHCWGGQGRSTTAIIYIFMKLFGVSYDDVYGRIYHRSKESLKFSEAQLKFLRGEEHTEEEIKDSEPIIKTPLNHPCYTK